VLAPHIGGGHDGAVSPADPSPTDTSPPRIPVTAAAVPEPPVEPDAGEEHRVTVYDALGGQAFFDRLVERFYAHVAADEVLLRLYPDTVDMGPARERLALFLGQYWGGPATYSERRGHPRLRMRHNPFAIGTEERDHWLAAMLESVDASMADTPLDDGLRDEVAQRLREYFTMAAEHLVNQPG